MTVSTMIDSKKKKASYFREVLNELKKVSWTPRDELILCTKAVIIATFIFGFGIYIVDLGIRSVLELATALVRAVFG